MSTYRWIAEYGDSTLKNDLHRVGGSARFQIAGWVAATCIGVFDARAGAAVNWPTQGWQQGTPAGVGLDEQTLAAFDADLQRTRYGLIDSFQVFRCGEEVFHRKYAHDYSNLYAKEAKTKGPLNARLSGPYNYFDTAWHPYYHGTDLHTMQSVSKTVTSIIFGIAMTRGDFKGSLNTPVLEYFDTTKIKNVDDRKRRMTLRTRVDHDCRP